MKLLFPSLESRFNADGDSLRICRKLYMGFPEGERQRAMPYVEAHLEDSVPADSFDSDIEEKTVTFSLYSGQSLMDRINDMIEHMRRVFKDAQLVSEDFTTAGCEWVSTAGPTFEDGTYQAQMTFKVTLERALKSPETRFAVTA